MPASERSLRLTDLYRQRLVDLRDRSGRLIRQSWPQVAVEDLDDTHAQWLTVAVAALEAAQRSGVALTAAYLATYVALERDETPEPPQAVSEDAVGAAQDGRPLSEALAATLITVKVALKDGAPPAKALDAGANRAARLGETATMAAPRSTLMDAIQADDRITGWRRVTSGGCGACLAAAADTIFDPGVPLKVHDHCRCTAEPVIADAPELVRRASGRDIFEAMTATQQDEALGPQAAAAVRAGTVPLEALLGTSPMEIGPDQITQAPIEG